MSTWLPISTAPKDGTPILAYIETVEWENEIVRGRTDYGFQAEISWSGSEWSFPENFGSYLTILPTHWQPLSEPPTPPHTGKE